MILCEKTSPMTGVKNIMSINATPEQFALWQAGGALIQDAMPEATVDQREFLISGHTPADWASLFPPQNAAEQADMEESMGYVMDESFDHPADFDANEYEDEDLA
jgi:hypothetical protein